MSFEKIAQDAYTQGLTETLRNMEVSDQIKIAAYKAANVGRLSLIGGAGTGVSGAEEGEFLTGGLKGLGNVAGQSIGYGLGIGLPLELLARLATKGKANQVSKFLGHRGAQVGMLGGAGKAMYENTQGDYGIFGGGEE
jgi:hypothetical protein